MLHSSRCLFPCRLSTTSSSLFGMNTNGSDEYFQSTNHAEQTFRKMENYLQQKQLCDVLLIVGDQKIPAHRYISQYCLHGFKAWKFWTLGQFMPTLCNYECTVTVIRASTSNGIKWCDQRFIFVISNRMKFQYEPLILSIVLSCCCQTTARSVKKICPNKSYGRNLDY